MCCRASMSRFGEGHTLGQQFVIVETAKGRMVVSGDCVYARAQHHRQQQ